MASSPEYQRADLIPDGVDATTVRRCLECIRSQLQAIACADPDYFGLVGRCAGTGPADRNALEYCLIIALRGARRRHGNVYEEMQRAGSQIVAERLGAAILSLSAVA